MRCPSSFSADMHGHLVLRVAWALTSVVQQVEAQLRIGRYALTCCVQKANALTLIVWKKYAVACADRTPYALTLVV